MLYCIRALKVWFLNRVISDISVVLRENTLNISDSTGKPVSMESEIVVSFRTAEISDNLKSNLQASDTSVFRGNVLGQDTSVPSLVLVKPRKA